MVAINDQMCLDLFMRAESEEIGIIVCCTNGELLRQRLYEYRNRLKAYDEFVLFIPIKDEVWIVKKATEMPE